MNFLDSSKQDTPHEMFGGEVGSTSVVGCGRSTPELRCYSVAQSGIGNGTNPTG